MKHNLGAVGIGCTGCDVLADLADVLVAYDYGAAA
jgi:hypothetical protein